MTLKADTPKGTPYKTFDAVLDDFTALLDKLFFTQKCLRTIETRPVHIPCVDCVWESILPPHTRALK